MVDRNMTPKGEGKQGVLYVVSTPIGNLEDITVRAIRILREADVIACEDTRKSRILLQKWNIATELMSLHKFSESRKIRAILERLERGQVVALITDAGTPAISDPGARLVRAALEAGVTVSPIPGPSIVAAALCVAGTEAVSFSYYGFVPRKDEERRKLFARICAEGHAAVVLESPRRIRDSLAVAADVLPTARMVLLRELTKMHEEILTGTADDLLEGLSARDVIKGEIAIVIEPPESSKPELNMSEIVKNLMEEGLSGKRLADEARKRFGVKKTEAYQVFLDLSGVSKKTSTDPLSHE